MHLLAVTHQAMHGFARGFSRVLLQGLVVDGHAIPRLRWLKVFDAVGQTQPRMYRFALSFAPTGLEIFGDVTQGGVIPQARDSLALGYCLAALARSGISANQRLSTVHLIR